MFCGCRSAHNPRNKQVSLTIRQRRESITNYTHLQRERGEGCCWSLQLLPMSKISGIWAPIFFHKILKYLIGIIPPLPIFGGFSRSHIIQRCHQTKAYLPLRKKACCQKPVPPLSKGVKARETHAVYSLVIFSRGIQLLGGAWSQETFKHSAM